MRIAIAMSHGHAPKWLQIILYSLKKFTNKVPCDVFVANTWPNHPSIKAATETGLSDYVSFIDCTLRLHSHATGLDQILDYLIEYGGYSHMFCAETDAMACQDNWLDWFVEEFEKARNCGMAGFFWHEGYNHYNINPSGTLYDIDMLKKYHKEVRENNSGMFWHPRGNRSDTESGMDPTIKQVAGAFSETRGIFNPNDRQREEILKGVPQAAWFEPGAWLYYRSLGEYNHVRVHCDHIYSKFGPVTSPEGTFYGGKDNPKYVHLWGGTRTYDFLKHPINDQFVARGAPYWLKREDQIWKATVPEEYRKIMPQIYEEMEYEKKIKENLPGWQKAIELVPLG